MILAWIAYYILVIPLSYLPLRVLYVFTDFFYLLLITIVPYRKQVIKDNIQRSFPDKTEKELRKIKRKFYRHFTDILAEGVKNLTISERSLRRRLIVENPALMEELFAKNKNVLLVSGHFNNWEWFISAQPLLFPHKAFGIGMPMTSKFWDQKINSRRQRFGMNVVHAKNYKEALNASSNENNAVLVLSDQSPGDSRKSYWMNFLNQQTAVLFGTEIMAHELNYSVVYFATRRTRRGYYRIELKEISADPKNMAWGEITEAHTRFLEQEILAQPHQWLWSHKRWKREIPDDLDLLKKEQREKFNSKYFN
ncbi:MAG: KDO2-lipid IV(A) lauroyltransferase [Crocinitomicaceae bacterium]|jgi:KDO2-lipid IV(A) lauroyltransferase